MYTVYVLIDKAGKLYKGATANLSRRLKEHRSGGVITTARMTGIELLYKEEFETWQDARKRELYLKSAAGRRFLKNKFAGVAQW